MAIDLQRWQRLTMSTDAASSPPRHGEEIEQMLVRALVIADRHRLWSVGARIDSALVALRGWGLQLEARTHHSRS